MALKAADKSALVRKQINRILQQNDKYLKGSRRIAGASDYERVVAIAISGGKETKRAKNGKELDGFSLARDKYHLELADNANMRDFKGIIEGVHFQKREEWDAWECAEARLWMTLFALHSRDHGGLVSRHVNRHPRHLWLWVYELTKTMTIKEDSPCKNCRQWVHEKFLKVNGG